MTNMRLALKPIKINQEPGKGERTMVFDPKEFYEMIQKNPDADIAIVDSDGEEMRTFNSKFIWELLFSN
jgi:hypothetical protein